MSNSPQSEEKHGLITFQDGHTENYNHGKLQSEGGPAVVWPFGTKIWYQDGLRHRTDGPALVDTGGNSKGIDEDGDDVTYQEWWIHGTQITEDKFNGWHDALEMVD